MTREEAYKGGQKLQTYITTDIDPRTERDKVIWLHDLDIKVKDKDSKEQLNKLRAHEKIL